MSRWLGLFLGAAVLGLGTGVGAHHHLTGRGLSVDALPAPLDPGELESLRAECARQADACATLGSAWLRAGAERAVRAHTELVRVSAGPDAVAGFFYTRACAAGARAACSLAKVLPPPADPFLGPCPTVDARVLDDEGAPVPGVEVRSECAREGAPPAFATDVSDLDGRVHVAGRRALVAAFRGSQELRVAPELRLEPWAMGPRGATGNVGAAAVVPLRRAPSPAGLEARDLDGTWWRQADPVSDQNREPWIRLDLPGATGGVAWDPPPPRRLRIDDGRLAFEDDRAPLTLSAGIATVTLRERAQLLIPVDTDTLVVPTWVTGFDDVYVYRRGW